jgi:dolichyl-phosphate-mannose--protein O-mannosyl transferase
MHTKSLYFFGQRAQYWIIGGMIYFAIMTIERVYARDRKIQKLEKEIID